MFIDSRDDRYFSDYILCVAVYGLIIEFAMI